MSKTYYMRFGSGDPRTFAGLAPTFLIFKLSNNTDVTPPSISEVGSSSGIFFFTYGTTTAIAFLADAATTSPGAVGRYVSGSIDPADRTDEYAATMIAIGTTAVALGTTTVALGTTTVALGTTTVALGTTTVSWGSAIGSTLTATGSTLVAIGNTSIAFGTTNVAIGTTGIAIGTTGLATTTNVGTTLVATGATLVAIGNTLTAIGSTVAAGFTFEIAGIGTTASSFGNSTVDPVDLFGYMKRVRELLEGNNSFMKQTGVLTMSDRAASVTLAVKTITNSASAVIKT